MELISQKIDFYGLNIYSGGRVKAGDDGKPVSVAFGPGHARNALMVEAAGELLAFHDGASKGTAGMIAAARKRRLRVAVELF